MPILLAETLITLVASLQRCCQGQETEAPFTDTNTPICRNARSCYRGRKTPFCPLPLWDWRFTSRKPTNGGGNHLSGRADEGFGEVLGKRSGFESGLMRKC
jgi:hypothetical protein